MNISNNSKPGSGSAVKPHSDINKVTHFFKDIQSSIDHLEKSPDIVDKIKKDPELLSSFCKALSNYLFTGFFSSFSEENILSILEKLKDTQQLVHLLIIPKCAKIFASALDNFLNSNKSGSENTLKLLKMTLKSEALTNLLQYPNYLDKLYLALEKLLFLNINNEEQKKTQKCHRLVSVISLLSEESSNLISLLLDPKIFPLLHKAISQFLKINVYEKRSNIYLLCQLLKKSSNLAILLRHSHNKLSCFPEFIDAAKESLSLQNGPSYDCNVCTTIFACNRSRSSKINTFFLFSGCLPDARHKEIIDLLEQSPSELVHKMNNEPGFYDDTLMCFNFIDLLQDKIKDWKYDYINDRKFIELFQLLKEKSDFKPLLEDTEFQKSARNALESAINNYKVQQDETIIDMFDMFLQILKVNKNFEEIVLSNGSWNVILEKMLDCQLKHYFQQASFELIYHIFRIKGLDNIVNKLLDESNYLQEADIGDLTVENYLSFFKILSIKPALSNHLTLNNTFKTNIKNLLSRCEIMLSDNNPKHVEEHCCFLTMFGYLKDTPELQRSIFENNSIMIKKLFGLAAEKLALYDRSTFRLDLQILDNNLDLQNLIIDIPEKKYIFQHADASMRTFPCESKDRTCIKLLSFLVRNPILQDIFDFDQKFIGKIEEILKSKDEEQKNKLSSLLLSMEKFQEFKQSRDPQKVDIYKQVYEIFSNIH